MKKLFLIIFFMVPIVCMDRDTAGSDMKRSASARILSELADLEQQGEDTEEEIEKIARRAKALQTMVRTVGKDTAGLGPRVREIEKTVDKLAEDVTAMREHQVTQFGEVRDSLRDIKDTVSAVSDDKYTAKLAAFSSVCIALGSQAIPQIMKLYVAYYEEE